MPDFRPLNSVISSVVKNGTLLTIQPGGNHGDELIYRGFNKIIAQLEIERTPLKDGNNRYDAPPELLLPNILKILYNPIVYLHHRVVTNPTAVYIHGGGNFDDIWGNAVACYKSAARYFNCPIIIGPQSCRFETTDPDNIFGGIKNQTHLFCREEYSFDLMESTASSHDHVSIHLADDTALSLSMASLPVSECKTEYSLVAMRSDSESMSPLLRESIDAPIKVSDISVAADSFKEFVQIAAHAEHIHTDRLHVAILATILNKPVTWYEVGYHKSRGVYEYSLSDVENIQFIYKEASQ